MRPKVDLFLLVAALVAIVTIIILVIR